MRPALRYASALALLLVLSSLPVGHAHVEAFSEGEPFEAGTRYSVFLDPVPAPLYAGSTVTLQGYLTNKETGALVSNVQFHVNVTFPSGEHEQTQLHSDGESTYIGGVVVTEPGTHVANVAIHDEDGVHEGSMDFEVYPDLPVRFSAADATADWVTNVSTPLRIKVVETSTYGPAPLDDVTMRIEHWSDDHTTLLGADEVPLARGSGVVWETQHTFRTPGMYHLRFASESGGFTYDDVPLLHIYTLDGGPPQTENWLPAHGLVGTLAALALAAAGTAVVAAGAARRARK